MVPLTDTFVEEKDICFNFKQASTSMDSNTVGKNTIYLTQYIHEHKSLFQQLRSKWASKQMSAA